MNKLSMTLNVRDQNLVPSTITIGYLNQERYDTTDTAAATAFRDDCRSFARALNGLTNNTLLNIILKSEEDITTGGE